MNLSILPAIKAGFRAGRVQVKQVLGIEPFVSVDMTLPLEYHGGGAGGWSIAAESLTRESIVVDIGIGEDLSFSESLIEKYGCTIYGFDPTPRAIEFVERLREPRLKLFRYAVGTKCGTADFYLPNNRAHVSGALTCADHLGAETITVEVVTLSEVLRLVGAARIDLLKMDIEGAEYDVLADQTFGNVAGQIGQICVEFHHRWKGFGKGKTLAAVARLRELGFRCGWACRATNEEFLFVAEAGPGTRRAGER